MKCNVEHFAALISSCVSVTQKMYVLARLILEAILAGIVQEIAVWIDEVNSKEILFVIKTTRKGIFLYKLSVK